MIEHTEIVEYGGPALAALATAVTAAKANAPLARVTVIVPSDVAGLAVRRRLGAGSGIANVAFLSPFRLAETLASRELLSRRPLTTAVLGAAVRRALRTSPGPFAAVRDHVATEVAIAALFTELSSVGPAALGRIATESGKTGRTAVDLHRTIGALLVGYHGEADLARAAASANLGATVPALGRVIWFLPQPATRPLDELVGSVLALAPSQVIVGSCGVEAADATVMRTCERAGVELAPLRVEPPAATRIVSVTDADEEVRAVVRRVVELAESGVALHRIGIFHPSPHPYLGLLEQQLAAARLPANGPSRHTLAESVAGRTLLAALDLPNQQWRRDRVLALVSGAPVRAADGSLAPASVWETLSRSAGVVQGRADWIHKLVSHAEWLTRRGEVHDIDVSHEVADIEALRAFVDGAADRLEAIHEGSRWREKSIAAGELLVALLGPSHRHASWPDAEQVCFERVEDALSRLGNLDDIEADPDPAVFTRALRAELDTNQPRLGEFGTGVLYGPLSMAIGHDLDAVFVLGCVEGLLPAARRDDAILPDAARRMAHGELDLRSDRLSDQHRAFLAALAAAPAGQRVLTMARSDLRGNRRTLPSRWLLDSATALAGGTVHSTGLEALKKAPWFEFVASHATGITGARVAASAAEHDLAAVAAWVDSGGDPLDHPATDTIRAGLAAQTERRSSRFTPWDGNLAGMPVESVGDRPWSPTRLETWASCGLRYFFTYVLGLSDRDQPERILDLNPLDRGSGVHESLERFIREAIETTPPDPSVPWNNDQRERLLEIAAEVFNRYEQRGRTGRSLHWQLTATDLAAMLLAFLDQDDVHRTSSNSRPFQVEYPFGRGEAAPVVIDLPQGRRLAFSGFADRIDRSESGTVYVSDYKTGKGDRYRGLDTDPVLGGTTLQLGIYAEAAAQHLGADQVETHYWMLHPDPTYRRRLGYRWTAERRQRLVEVVTAIVDGIDAGTFPAVPGEWNSFRSTHDNCTYCAFDQVCVRDRGEQFRSKSSSVELRVRDRLMPEGR